MANIVTHGLGQPDEGAIVALGMGASEPAPPGAMSATLSGSGSLTAALTATGEETPVTAGCGQFPSLFTEVDYLTLARLDDDLLLLA